MTSEMNEFNEVNEDEMVAYIYNKLMSMGIHCSEENILLILDLEMEYLEDIGLAEKCNEEE